MGDICFGDSHIQAKMAKTADGLQLTLIDSATKVNWGPVPLFVPEIHNKTLRRSEPLSKVRVDKLEELADGVHVSLTCVAEKISFALWLRIIDGRLRVMFCPSELYEADAGIHRLYAIDVLPGLLRVGAEGTMLMPVNTGAICRPAGKPALADRFLLYGEQDRWELIPCYPLCAAWDATAGLSALVTTGDCDAECRVSTDGKDNGQIGFAFRLRQHWIDPVDFENRELVIAPFAPQADEPVAHCAKVLRRHIMDFHGKKTLRERAAESPEVAYMLEACTMKLFHGVQNTGAMVAGGKSDIPAGEMINCMTFDEAAECLRKLKAAGVDKILTQNVGWNARGHDGLYPTRFPVEQRFGGEERFRAMIDTGHELGYQINVHDNFLMNTPASPDWDAEYVIQDVYGEPLVHGCWAAGIEYAAWGNALPTDRVEGHMQKVKALGIKGMFYMDYMVQPLEVNYHPRHAGPRRACADGQRRILRAAREIFGSVGTEMGFLPGVIECDYVVTGGEPWHMNSAKDEWGMTHLIDRIVPVSQLAYSGLIVNEARNGISWGNTCEAILFGQQVRDEWSARPGVMPVLDDKRTAALKAIYDLCVVRFGHLRLLEITAYSEADGIRTTTYEDGTMISLNTNTMELSVNGEVIPRPPKLG